MEWLDRFSGKTVEDKVSHYSEIYGEILLGMHRDIERLHRVIEENNYKVQQALAYMATTRGEVTTKAEAAQAASIRAQEWAETAHKSSDSCRLDATKAELLVGKLKGDMLAVESSLKGSVKPLRNYVILIGIVSGLSLLGIALCIIHFKF